MPTAWGARPAELAKWRAGILLGDDFSCCTKVCGRSHPAQLVDEPIAGQRRDVLERAAFFEEVGGAGNDGRTASPANPVPARRPEQRRAHMSCQGEDCSVRVKVSP